MSSEFAPPFIQLGVVWKYVFDHKIPRLRSGSQVSNVSFRPERSGM